MMRRIVQIIKYLHRLRKFRVRGAWPGIFEASWRTNWRAQYRTRLDEIFWYGRDVGWKRSKSMKGPAGGLQYNNRAEAHAFSRGYKLGLTNRQSYAQHLQNFHKLKD